MSDQAQADQGQQPAGDNGGAHVTIGNSGQSNAAAIADMRAKIANDVINDDSIEVDTPSDGADDAAEQGGEASEKPKKAAKAAKDEKATGDDAKGDEKPKRKSLAELEELAAQKRRERKEREAREAGEKRARDLDREREEIERQRRDVERAKEALRKDPVAYMERELGLDPSVAAEKLVNSQLRPAEAKLQEIVAKQQAELEALRKRYETDTETRERQAREAQEHAHREAIYSQWDKISGDAEKFPHTSKLPTPLRRQYGDHVANLLTAAGIDWTPDDVAAQVEHDLAERFAAAVADNAGSSAGENDDTDGSPAGGKKPPPKTLTNDLASESAGISRDLLDPEVRRQNALREAARLGLK